VPGNANKNYLHTVDSFCCNGSHSVKELKSGVGQGQLISQDILKRRGGYTNALTVMTLLGEFIMLKHNHVYLTAQLLSFS
jgi:hypothetical protein